MYDLFTSRNDVSHAMGFRVWGRNSIKNHSLTLLDINLCIKSGLNTSFLPLADKFTCSKSRCTYIWGLEQRRECAELLGQIQNGVLSLEASWCMVFSDSKPDQYIPLWDQKMERKYATEYSTACREMGVWVLKVTITCLERFVREDPNTANTDEVSLSLLQIGANSYHEVALRSLWSLERRAG